MRERVTWDNLFPRAEIEDEPVPGIFKETLNDPCWRCGRPTQWVSLSWEAAICSFICDDLAWVEYGNDVWGTGWIDQPQSST